MAADGTWEQMRKDAALLWGLLEPALTAEQVADKVRSVAAEDLRWVVASLKFQLEERMFWRTEGPRKAIRNAGRWGPDA